MDDVKTSETLREAVGVFHNPDRLQAAIDELQSSGFNHHDISLLASQKAIEDKLGHVYVRSEVVENEPEATHQDYSPPEDRGNAKGIMIGVPLYVAATVAAGLIAATGGTLALLLGGAAIAGGSAGLVGLIFANKLEHDHAEAVMAQLDRGGLLLWVRTSEPDLERTAMAILTRHGATDVHVHVLRSPKEEADMATMRARFSTGHSLRI